MKFKRIIYPYNHKLKELARKLRNNSTFAEVLLWNELKNNKITNYDFHRQKPILNYIVDFICLELKLVIEVDGISHNNQGQLNKDSKRQNEIEALGLTFLRFDDDEIKTQIEAVVNYIKQYIENYEKSKID